MANSKSAAEQREGESAAISGVPGRVPFRHEELKTSFTLPAKVTVRQQLAYKGVIGRMRGRDDYYAGYWSGGLALIGDWQSEILPDPAAVDLDEETNPDVADLIFWAASVVAGHMMTLGGETVPKN
jgi:hypothetical protein